MNLKSFSMSNTAIRVLVVDDMGLSRNTAKKHMNALGFNNIDFAEHGLKAWELLEAAHKEGKPFDLVLSDWIMPELDGLGLLEKIKESGWEEVPPLLMLTAETAPKQVLEAVKAGISGYVTKPIQLESLKNTLEALDRRSQKQAA